VLTRHRPGLVACALGRVRGLWLARREPRPLAAACSRSVNRRAPGVSCQGSGRKDRSHANRLGQDNGRGQRLSRSATAVPERRRTERRIFATLQPRTFSTTRAQTRQLGRAERQSHLWRNRADGTDQPYSRIRISPFIAPGPPYSLPGCCPRACRVLSSGGIAPDLVPASLRRTALRSFESEGWSSGDPAEVRWSPRRIQVTWLRSPRSGDQDELSADVGALADTVGLGGAVERERLHLDH
jgi:hypothetical protein